MERLTYKSAYGDYGTLVDCVRDRANLCKLFNRLGAYEDLGTVEELAELKRKHEAEQYGDYPEPLPLNEFPVPFDDWEDK